MFKQSKDSFVVHKVIKTQLVLAVAGILCIGLVTRNFNSILSVMFGCIVAFVPTLIYVKVAFQKGLLAYPNQVLKRHQRAVVLRFLVSFFLFSLICYSYSSCNFLLLLVAYVITLSSYWIILITK